MVQLERLIGNPKILLTFGPLLAYTVSANFEEGHFAKCSETFIKSYNIDFLMLPFLEFLIIWFNFWYTDRYFERMFVSSVSDNCAR